MLTCAILGGGGHARVLLDCLLDNATVKVWGVLDRERAAWGSTIFGVNVAGGDELLPTLRGLGVTHFAVGLGSVGDNRPRARLFRLALAQGLEPLTIRHPTAWCSTRAVLGAGAQLLAGAVVNAGAVLGVNVLVNTGSIIEHDCRIGAHAHIATGARLAGGVQVGEGAHVGAGCTVRQGITLGDHCVVGAGAVVVSDVAPHSVVVGVPARVLRQAA